MPQFGGRMFNHQRYPYQIGMEDGGGGSIHPNRYESPPKKLVQLRYNEQCGCWVNGENGMMVLSFKGDMAEPMCAVGDVIIIKIRDYIIECKKTDTSTFSILTIKASDGAIFNTLQLIQTDPLIKMLRVYITVPITDMYK
ncbi:hypothetical protein D9M71_497340 [compost metagenome]